VTPLLAAALILGLVTGAVGKAKGSSFWIWFLTGTIVPGIGLAAVILMRTTKQDPRRECPNCSAVLPITAQVCMRCGEDLDYPEELIAPKGHRPPA
jgi:DNA-directed RNA polymerase subunit RPC12/RpoP